jgi:polysaccharide deacetylase family protein (PEP-CTERM system associated)
VAPARGIRRKKLPDLSLGNDTSIILSFDVEEHHRIEAAAGISCPPALQAEYGERMEKVLAWLLEALDQRGHQATFFVLGQIGRTRPDLIRTLHRAGHEVASHGWSHRRLHLLTPERFRQEVWRSKDILEQITGEPVAGFRAPTFSVVPQTAWAIDILIDLGIQYDSSIYPVRHDRYGVPEAPRTPFLVSGSTRTLLEFPPATWRWAGTNVPVGGGGYFRLLPLAFMERAFDQVRQAGFPAVSTIYFHPWELDPDQPRLPLKGLKRFRTYVGLGNSRERLAILLDRHHFRRARDVAEILQLQSTPLPVFALETGKELEFHVATAA